MALPRSSRPTTPASPDRRGGGHPRSTGRSRRLAREADLERGRRAPGDPRVVISADEARALDEANRDQRRQRAQRAGRPTALEVLGGRPGVPVALKAARGFDPARAQRPGRTAGPRGAARHGWRRDQAAADAVLAPTVAAFRDRALEALPA